MLIFLRNHDDVIKGKHFSAVLAICAGNSQVTREFSAQKLVTQSFDVFFDQHLNNQLSKQSWGCWFETPSCPLWRHCHDPGQWSPIGGLLPTLPISLCGTALLSSQPRAANGLPGTMLSIIYVSSRSSLIAHHPSYNLVPISSDLASARDSPRTSGLAGLGVNSITRTRCMGSRQRPGGVVATTSLPREIIKVQSLGKLFIFGFTRSPANLGLSRLLSRLKRDNFNITRTRGRIES